MVDRTQGVGVLLALVSGVTVTGGVGVAGIWVAAQPVITPKINKATSKFRINCGASMPFIMNSASAYY